MAAIENRVNDGAVAPWLVREITEAIAALEVAEPWAIKEAEKALLAAAEPLTGLKSREADELWKLIGKARAAAAMAMLPYKMERLEKRFGNGHNGHPKRGRRNGQPAKPGQVLPPGELSPFAGQPAEKWQVDLEGGRQRQISGGVPRRGAPVPGTRKPNASSKKT